MEMAKKTEYWSFLGKQSYLKKVGSTLEVLLQILKSGVSL